MSGESKDKKATQTWKVTWANIYLDSAQKEAAKLFCADPERTVNMAESLLTDGYTISFAFSEKSDSVVCTLTGKNCVEANKGVAMATHGSSIEAALHRALFKHYVLCDGSSWMEVAEGFDYPQP